MAPYSIKQTNDSSDPIGRFITDRSRMAPPTKDEYTQLFEELHKGSESAKQELVERHIRLVASIALKFRQVNVPMEDVMAEGIHGLVIAIEKFDHTRGIKLSTYAAWWIRQRIQRFVSKMAEAVSIPHDVSQGKRKENNLRTELQISLGRNPPMKKSGKLWPTVGTSLDGLSMLLPAPCLWMSLFQMIPII